MTLPDELPDAFRIRQWLFRPQLNRAEANGTTRQLEPKLMQVFTYARVERSAIDVLWLTGLGRRER